MHARTSSPSSSTEHAPHCAIPQPRRGPVNFSSLRSTNSKGVSGAEDTTWFAPFTDSVSSFAMTLPPEQPDFTALRAAGGPMCRHTCSIEEFHLFGGEFQIQPGESVLELRYLPRSHDRDYWRSLMEQPGECDLR